ncbi:MAG TPA: hypothetical protein VHM02_16085, partial [Thermoanaerobaculia bacterium]|nr:hypothetical protein [Thermoanaerobaculia bacterium]
AAAALLAVAALLLPALDLFKSARPLARAFVAESARGTPFAVYPHLDSTVLFYSARRAVPFDSPEELRAYLDRPGRGWVFVGRHDLERVTAGDPPLVLVAAETPAERDGYLLLAEAPRPP